MANKPPTKTPSTNLTTDWSQQVHKVLTTYKPRDPEKAIQYIEDIRKLVVLTEANFRRIQKSGHFTDTTGDQFLENALKSLVTGPKKGY